MKFTKESNEVCYSDGPITKVGPEEISFLKAHARENPTKKARLCAPIDVTDGLHEMLIVMSKETSVAP